MVTPDTVTRHMTTRTTTYRSSVIFDDLATIHSKHWRASTLRPSELSAAPRHSAKTAAELKSGFPAFLANDAAVC